MSAEFRLVEVLIMEAEPHPLEVEKGNFNYWNTIATLAGIDLNEEAAIALNDFQQVGIGYFVGECLSRRRCAFRLNPLRNGRRM